MKNFGKLSVSILVCELVGILSTPFTIASIPTWYAGLIKPPFSPPNWLFGPVWTILYFLMGIAAYFIWKKGLKNKKVKIALKYFLIQLLLNFIWSPLFFGLHLPLLALFDICILLVMIVMTMKQFRGISKPAFYLFIPYLLWVSFATLLNLSIVILNR